jgi:hypothetical protein
MQLNRKEAAALLRDPETYMTTLFVILHAEYGEDVYFEDPLVLFADLEEDFNAKLTLQAENRINAGLTCIPSDRFYRDPTVFSAVVNTLYSGGLGDDIFLDEMTVPEIIWAGFEMEFVREVIAHAFGMDLTIPESQQDFSPAINRLVKAAADKESIAAEEMEDLEPYQDRFIRESLVDLEIQLKKIGYA